MKKLLSLFFLTTLFITPSYSAQSGQSLMLPSGGYSYYPQEIYAQNQSFFVYQELPPTDPSFQQMPFQQGYPQSFGWPPQPFYIDPHTGLPLVPITTYAMPYPVQTIPLQDAATAINIPTDIKNDNSVLLLQEASSGKKQALFNIEKKTKGLGGMSLTEILTRDSHAFLVCTPSKIKEDFIFSQPQFMDIRPERFNISEIETPQIYEFINDQGTVKSRCITQIIIHFLKLQTADPKQIVDFAKRLELNSPSDKQVQEWHREINEIQEKKIELPQKDLPTTLPVASFILPAAPKELTDKELAAKELAEMKQQIEQMAHALTLQTQELEQLKKKEFAEKAEQEKLLQEKIAFTKKRNQNKKAAAQQQKKATQQTLEAKKEQEKQLKIIQQQEAEALIKQKEEQAKAEAHRQKEETRLQKIKALQEAREAREAQEKAAREEQEKIAKMNQRQVILKEALAHKNEKAKVKALIDQKINADNLAKRMKEKTLKEAETKASQSKNKKTKKSVSQSASLCSKNQKLTKGKQDEEALFLAQEAARVKEEKDTLLKNSIKKFNIADTNRLQALTEKNYELSLQCSLDKLNVLINIKKELPQETSFSIKDKRKTLVEFTQDLIDEVTKDIETNPRLKETEQYTSFITKLTEIVSKKNILFEVLKEGKKQIFTSVVQKRSDRLSLEKQVKLLNQQTMDADFPKEEPTQITLNSYETGLSLFEQGKIKDALSHFEHAGNLGHQSAFLNIAECLRLLGNIDESLEILNIAFKTMNDFPEEIRSKIPGQLALTLWKKPDTLNTEIFKLLHQGQSLKDVDCYFFEALLLREGKHPDWPQEKMCTLVEPHYNVKCSCEAIFKILHNNNQENPKEEELSERALREIGSMYETGEGVIKNTKKAVHCYSLSSKKGNNTTIGSAYLGRCLCEGIGCPKDFDKGIKLLAVNADKSSIIAQRFLLHEIIKHPHQDSEKKDLEYFSYLSFCLKDLEQHLDEKEIKDIAIMSFKILYENIETIQILGSADSITLRPAILYGYNILLNFVTKYQNTFRDTFPEFVIQLARIANASEKTTAMYITKLPQPEHSDQIILLTESCKGSEISRCYKKATEQVCFNEKNLNPFSSCFSEYKKTLLSEELQNDSDYLEFENLYKNERKNEALSLLENLATKKQDPHLYVMLGLIQKEYGQEIKALESFNFASRKGILVACKEGSFLAQEIGKIKKEKGEHEEAKKYFISALESFKTLSESHDQALKVTGVKGIATLFLEQNHPAIFDIRTLHQTNTDFCKEMSICPCQHALLILETEKQEQECANMCAQIYCGRYSTCSKITRDYDKALDVLKPFKDTLPDFVLPTIEGFKLLRSLDTSDQQKGYEIINAQYTINKNNLINYQSLEESRDTIIVPLCHEILKNTEICISIKPKPEIIKDLTTQTQSIIKLYKTNFSQELAEILFSINNNLIKSINKHHDIFPFNDILKYQTILAIGQSEITNYLINTSDRFDKKTESCYKQTKGYIDKFFAPTLLELNNQSISEKKAFEQIIELVSQGSVYWGENFNYLFKILPLIQKLQTETQTECPYFTEKKRVLERAYYLIKKEVPAEIERLKNTSLQEGDNQFSLYKQALTLQKSCDIIPGLEQYKEEISQECATLKKSLETFNRDVYAQTQKLKKTAQVLSQISHILKPHEISCYLPGASAPLEEDIFKKLQNTSTTTKPIYAALLNEIVKLHTNPTEANISLLVKNKKNLFDIYTLGIAHQRNKESINTIHGLCLAIPYLNAEEQGAAQARMHQLITTISHDLLREISTSSGDAQKVYKDVFQHLLITFHTEPDYKQTILKILKSEFNTSDFLK